MSSVDLTVPSVFRSRSFAPPSAHFNLSNTEPWAQDEIRTARLDVLVIPFRVFDLPLHRRGVLTNDMPTFYTNQPPRTVWALLVLLAIQGVGATAGSAGLVQNPVKNIGLRVSMALLGVVILILALARPTRRFFWVGR